VFVLFFINFYSAVKTHEIIFFWFQVEGAFMQGLGYVTNEQLVNSSTTGKVKENGVKKKIFLEF
jgi:hypothetical protein